MRQYGPAPLDSNEERLDITELIVHPEYDSLTFENDIVVVKVAGSFNCSPDKIYPACLPNTEVRSNTQPHTRLRSRDVEIHLHWVGGHHPVWVGAGVSSG